MSASMNCSGMAPHPAKEGMNQQWKQKEAEDKQDRKPQCYTNLKEAKAKLPKERNQPERKAEAHTK